MSKPTYSIEIAWTRNNTGNFIIGTSLIGGTDTIASEFGNNAFDDISEDVAEVSLSRGRTSDLAQLMAGSCTVVLNDIDGKYNPMNDSSELYPNVKAMKPIRIIATLDGTEYDRFYGYIQRITNNPRMGDYRTVLECTDLFCWLQAAKPVISSTGPTTVGGAIGAILDAVEFTEIVYRSLDTGDSIDDFSSDGSSSALELISGLLVADRGVFFISRAGVATYEDREAKFKRTTDQNTLEGTFDNLSGSTDVAQVYNEIRVNRDGGTQQTQEDEDSIRAYARRPLDISSDYIQSDSQSNALAGWILLNNKDPKQPLTMDLVRTANNNQLQVLLERDLNERIAVIDDLGGTDASFFIESMQEVMGNAGFFHGGTMLLSRKTLGDAFIIGSSLIGSTDIITY